MYVFRPMRSLATVSYLLQYCSKVKSHSLALLLQVSEYTQSRNECTIYLNSTRHSRIVESQFSLQGITLHDTLEFYSTQSSLTRPVSSMTMTVLTQLIANHSINHLNINYSTAQRHVYLSHGCNSPHTWVSNCELVHQ